MWKIRMRLDGSADLRQPFSVKAIERYTARADQADSAIAKLLDVEGR